MTWPRRALWPHIQAALRWIVKYGDRDGDGFVEYGRRSAEGLLNQGWKDSRDSIFHADGTLAEGPIALAEVQAYVYGAWTSAAARSAWLRLHRARRQHSMHALRSSGWRFDKAFFDEALGTRVLALDGDKRPCRVLSSNAGHALYTEHCLAGARGAGGGCPDGELIVFRLGSADHCIQRKPVQPDELPQWFGLAP
ncbi:hypothetical protein ACTMU2_38940 [Cupriavidus basilensis]